MNVVNRSALSVKPTQVFVDWINQLDATEGEDDLTLADVERESTVYLIGEMDSEEAVRVYVRDRYLDILENELRAWEEDVRLWPETLDWALFERFIQVDYSYLTLDLEAEPLDSQSLENEELLLDQDDE